VLASSFTHTVQDGPLIVAAGVSLLVGLLGFLSPCVLPLVPGYLSYVAGLGGADPGPASGGSTGSGDASVSGGSVAVIAPTQRRMVIGAVLFVVGFSVIFVAQGLLFGSLGEALRDNKVAVERVLGVVVIILGLVFMGYIPGLQREYRLHRLAPAGLVGAPLVGAAFGLAWGPCLTPTLGVVYSMSYTEGSAGRGALLMFFYCLGLGVPFVLMALGFGWISGALGFVRQHRLAISRVGGGLLVLMGVLLVSGAWDHFADWLRQEFGSATGVGSDL
jgi:cytochrome c-type biogenesis protein